MNIEFREKLSEKEEKWINNEFEKHEAKYGLKCNYKPFNFIAKEDNQIVGCITGASVYDAIYVDELIVCENHRSKGIGTKLLQQVEEYCRDKHLRYIELVTNEYQALEFYEKYGFKLEFTRENTENSKLSKYFLIKYI